MSCGISYGAGWCGKRLSGHRHGYDEDIDNNEVKGKEPGGLAQFILGGILDERYVKLPGEQKNADETQQGDGQENAAVNSGIEDLGNVRPAHGLFDQVPHSAGHAVDHVYADKDKSGNLDNQFNGDRKHEPALVFRRGAVPRAKQDRERRQHERYDKVHFAGGQRGGLAGSPPCSSSTAIACEMAFS